MRHEYRQHWLNAPVTRRGMTLIEIMVVVGIIAILATIVIWASGGFIDRAKTRETEQVLRDLQNAVVAYKDETGTYPANPYPFDIDDRVDSSGNLMLFRSIPPVNPADPSPGSDAKTQRVDFYQVLDPNDKDNESGSFRAPLHDPTLAPTVCGPTGPCQANGDKLSAPQKVYGIQMLVYRLSMHDKTSLHLNKLPEELRAAPGTPKFPLAVMPNPAVFLGDYNEDEEKFFKVKSAEVVLDAWKRPIYYGWHQNVNNGVPFLQSAGPDGLWDLSLMRPTDNPSPGITDDDVFSFLRSQ